MDLEQWIIPTPDRTVSALAPAGRSELRVPALGGAVVHRAGPRLTSKQLLHALVLGGREQRSGGAVLDEVVRIAFALQPVADAAGPQGLPPPGASPRAVAAWAELLAAMCELADEAGLLIVSAGGGDDGELEIQLHLTGRAAETAGAVLLWGAACGLLADARGVSVASVALTRSPDDDSAETVPVNAGLFDALGRAPQASR